MKRPRLLDLFCGAGGCSTGYHRAGFDVVGIDIEPHAEYPYSLTVSDITQLKFDRINKCWHPNGDPSWCLGTFEVVAASPPCPRYSTATPEDSRTQHPDLIEPIRSLLETWGGPYVIENVPGSPLESPLKLCGSMFDLGVRRHRLFESNVFMFQPECSHQSQGQPWGVTGESAEIGDYARHGRKARTVTHAQQVMGIEWMNNWSDLADAIPPAYTEWIGTQLLDILTTHPAAASVAGNQEATHG